MTDDDTQFELDDSQVQAFAEDGFVIVERIIDPAAAALALARYEELFAGRFETGLYPDEWNWKSGRDSEDLTRQICNAWKSDRDIAGVVLRRGRGTGVCAPGGMAGNPAQPGQRLVEAPGRAGARIPSGFEL